MKLSTRTRYGLRAMVEIGRSDPSKPVSLDDISLSQGISVKYLHSLLTILKSGGLVKSVRGRGGGYVLARDPATVTIYEVYSVLEGPLRVVDCIGERVCDRSSQCPVQGLWEEVNSAVREVLMKDSLENIIRNSKCVRSQD